MTRRVGTPNRATAERRAALLARMRERLHDRAQGAPSWRELAAAAGVSLSTLSHHFGRRDDVVRAVFENDRVQGAEPLAVMATPTGPLPVSIRDAVDHLAGGLIEDGLDRMIAAGLAEGLGSATLGPAFVGSTLEPILAAVEARLDVHVARGELRGGAVRLAAVSLVSPVLVAVLHQRPLGGSAVRPLDLDAFCEGHVAAFLRAWAVKP